ncbi:hypothetical protein AAFF_G00132670 [Aldrovandia affinis]|uniref:Uncharacterized protein n=1 Tax=Aldrovandia affinis TaxID=143900 RepID=A0AAD7RQH7_9TELE|nr:hypothetical protein AAFF_G00132670 [Aldrovandia affinis]
MAPASLRWPVTITDTSTQNPSSASVREDRQLSSDQTTTKHPSTQLPPLPQQIEPPAAHCGPTLGGQMPQTVTPFSPSADLLLHNLSHAGIISWPSRASRRPSGHGTAVRGNRRGRDDVGSDGPVME